jgi:muramidase (phage lysozyme)
MSTLTITQQDKALLALVAKGESSGRDPYIALWPGTTDSRITSMTLTQIDQFQTSRINSGYRSSACGRYQFIRGTLREVVKQSGLPLTTIFTPDVQDYLIVVRLKKTRKYDSWKSGGLTDDKFMIELAKEFASIPVPYSIQGNKRQVSKGQSFYAGDGLNKANHDPDHFLQELADIRAGGAGSTITLSTAASSAPNGFLPSTQAEVQAGGGQRLRGGIGAMMPIPSGSLPSAADPYLYVSIAPENNRYDFRTGKKVTDLLVNGINPPSNGGLINGNGRPPVDDIGNNFYNEQQAKDFVKDKISVGYDTGKIDPALARAAGIIPGVGTVQSSSITKGLPAVKGKSIPAAPKLAESNLSFGAKPGNTNQFNSIPAISSNAQ